MKRLVSALPSIGIVALAIPAFVACADDETSTGAAAAEGSAGNVTGAGAASSSSSMSTGGSAGSGAAGGAGGNATTSTCGAKAPPRAVVMGLNGDTDAIAVMRFEDGELHDDGIRFPIDNPRGVAMRSDGAEALVAWGGFGDEYGFAVVSIAAGGASAELVDTITIGTGQTPWSVAYASDDHAAIVTAGPTEGTLIGIDRAGGNLAVGQTMSIPGNWPLEVAGRPGHDELVFTRVDFATDDATQIFRVQRSGDAWQIAGAAGEIAPPTLHVALHPGGTLVYGPTSDPDNPVAIDNLDAKGVLHVLTISDAGINRERAFPIPGLSSFVSAPPSAEFLVLPTPVYEVDANTNTPLIRNYALYTVPLDPTGAPTGVLGPTAAFPGLLFDDVDVTSTGHLVTTMEMYPDQAPPAETQPVVVWAQPSPGAWERCQTLYPGGAADVAIAP